MKRLTALICLISLTFGLSGCVSDLGFSSQQNTSKQVLTAIKNSLPDNWKVVDETAGSSGCFIDSCDPNSAITIGPADTNIGRVELCKQLIKIAEKNGLNAWYFGGSRFPYKGMEAQTQMNCVAADSYQFEGLIPGSDSSNVWTLTGDRYSETKTSNFVTSFGHSSDIPSPDLIQNFQDLNYVAGKLGGVSRGSLLTLSAISNYRLHHPNAPLYGVNQVKRALADVATTTNVKLISKNGQVRWIYLPDNPTSGTCISIGKYDPKYFGVADPGSYYPVSLADLQGNSLHFGRGMDGKPCQKLLKQ